MSAGLMAISTPAAPIFLCFRNSASAVAAKVAAHWITTGLPLVLAAPVFGVLLHLPAAAQPWLVGSLLLGTPALSMLGAFGAALTVGVRRGGLLLSALVLPLYIPTLIFGAETVRLGAAGQDPATPLALLAGSPGPERALPCLEAAMPALQPVARTPPPSA